MDEASVVAVIIDNHWVVGPGVRQLCSTARPPIVIIEAKTKGDLWTGPGGAADVVILDLRLQAGPELGELRRLVAKGRRVIVYTGDTRVAMATTCIKLGAMAYITKDEGPDHLIAAIHAAADGEEYTTPALAGAMLIDDDPSRPQLTNREVEVVQTWIKSGSKRIAAKKLHITEPTVNTTIARVRRKYEEAGRAVSSQGQLLLCMLDDGIAPVSEDDDDESNYDAYSQDKE